MDGIDEPPSGLTRPDAAANRPELVPADHRDPKGHDHEMLAAPRAVRGGYLVAFVQRDPLPDSRPCDTRRSF